jgi:hypothetical protein
MHHILGVEAIYKRLTLTHISICKVGELNIFSCKIILKGT